MTMDDRPLATNNDQILSSSNSSVPSDPLTSGPTGSMGSSSTAAPYINPSTPTGGNPTFGDVSKQNFNVPQFLQPFPFPQQKSEDAQYIQDHTNFLQNQETIPQIQDRYANRYDIPNLQEQAARGREAQDMVGNQIRALPQDVNQRSANSLMTQGQADRVINKEAQPLLASFNQIGQGNNEVGQRLAIAEQNLNNAAKLEMAQQQKMDAPWLQKYDMNSIMHAREFSGWTFAGQTELSRLLANQSAGLTWTNSEAERANRLAVVEAQFQDQLKVLDKQNQMYTDMWQ